MRKKKIIAVTSPATDAGKTLIAVGLAEAAAARGLRTLFIELDNPVGDSLRVFGINPQAVYPTMATWQNHDWEGCLKTKNGTYIIPKPEMLRESAKVTELLENADDFDLIVADMGTDYRKTFWKPLVEVADLPILVVDCDEKALVRVKGFLNALPLSRDWLLIINSREPKSYYPPRQIMKLFEEQVIETMMLPHIPNIEKQLVKTFPADSMYGQNILAKLFSDINPVEIKVDEHQLRNFFRFASLGFLKRAINKRFHKQEKPTQITAPHNKLKRYQKTECKPKMIFILGDITIDYASITSDPAKACAAISDIACIRNAPPFLPLFVVAQQKKITDWVYIKIRQDAVLCNSAEEALRRILSLTPSDDEMVVSNQPADVSFDLAELTNIANETPANAAISVPVKEKIELEHPKRNISVLPGNRSRGPTQTIIKNGAVYVVCPSNPALAGNIAANLSLKVPNSALIGASGDSRAALDLGIPSTKLIEVDWRFPLSNAPIRHSGVTVWPIDPMKYIDEIGNVHALVDSIKLKFNLTIIDCAGSFKFCTRIANDESVLLVAKEADMDAVTSHWYRNFGRRHATLISPTDTPDLMEVENGFIITCFTGGDVITVM